MKKYKHFTIIVAILLIIAIINPFRKTKNNENKDETEYEYISQEFSYNIDMDNLDIVKENSDILFVGTVIEQKETEYIGEQKFEDKFGNVGNIEGIPFTNFSIKIEEVIKGNLKKGDIINIKKHGGVSQSSENIFYLDDGGVFPKKGNKYIIFSNYQEDGSLLSYGRNTIIEYNDEKFNELNKD